MLRFHISPADPTCPIKAPGSRTTAIRPRKVGLLESANVPQLEDVLFGVLPHAREVSSSTPVMGYLLEKCEQNPLALVMRLLSQIQLATDEAAQNRIAYAIWSSVREFKRGPSSVEHTIACFKDASAAINDAIAASLRCPISQYAHSALEEYQKRITRL